MSGRRPGRIREQIGQREAAAHATMDLLHHVASLSSA